VVRIAGAMFRIILFTRCGVRAAWVALGMEVMDVVVAGGNCMAEENEDEDEAEGQTVSSFVERRIFSKAIKCFGADTWIFFFFR
jgi:hypothetical protein